MPELSDEANVVIGILVGLVSTCVQSIGLTQQRKSHLLEEQKRDEIGEHATRPAYRRRRWQLGMLMFLVSNIVGSSIQITTLPLPVLSTLQASGLVFNTVCATIVLGEPFTRYSLFGTVLVTAGAVLVGIFGSLTEPSHNLGQLLGLLGRREFVLWLSCTFFVVFVIIVCVLILKRLHPRQTHRVRLIRGMSYGAVSGILSAHCLLLAKSAVELLVRTFHDRVNQFNKWQSWMIILGLIVLALLQLYYLHRGLKLCSTSVLYPFVFCVYNIVAILDGLIYFDQSSRLTAVHAGLIALGTVVLLGGVFALSWRLQADDALPGPSAVDVKAKSRVVTPRTILQPGMGLQEESDEEDEEPVFVRPADDEEALNKLHANEHTPLLRTKTSLNRPQKHTGTQEPALRPPKTRRMTTIVDDNSELWDELHDRPNSRRFSAEYSPQSVRSPGHSRSQKGRSTSGPHRAKTLPTRRNSSARNLASLPRTLLGSKKSRRSPSCEVSSPPPPSDQDDTGDEDTLLRRNPWASITGESSKTQSEAKPDWFKLKWWKKRWRTEDDEGDGT